MASRHHETQVLLEPCPAVGASIARPTVAHVHRCESGRPPHGRSRSCWRPRWWASPRTPDNAMGDTHTHGIVVYRPLVS